MNTQKSCSFHFHQDHTHLRTLKNPHKSLTKKLSKIYGPIMTLKLGNITSIVISSPQLTKQVARIIGLREWKILQR
ncbi:cytochrome P450 family protein [Medicago truncatula]|uniref:Cytochrome P450 family protein n=1 Tax=Medicago truncatula TaxID=3880 RepID=G7L1D2_MEDTR|nr:cytochrome P450 family protein [Medicago truncatula]